MLSVALMTGVLAQSETPCVLPLTPLSEIRVVERLDYPRRATEVQPDDQAFLVELARTLKEHPEIPRLAVLGHASRREGGDPRSVGQRRAEAVREVLIGYGVPPERLEAGSWGDQPPDVLSGTPAPSGERWVEFVVCPAEGCFLPG